MAVLADGSVVAWGGNTYGERDVPVGLRNVKQVSASGYFTLALSGPLDPLDFDSDNDGLLDGHDITLTSSDDRYDDFANAGIIYTNNGADRIFFGEIDASTDPFNWQSSGCGIPDGWAVVNGFDPLDPTIKTQDSDSDGFTNYEEMIYGTNPKASDSDGDGVSDYIEIMNGSDPLDASETSNPSGAATFLLSADYQEPDGTGTGDGSAFLHIGPLTLPFSHELPLVDTELQLPRGEMYEVAVEGAPDHLGGALALSVDPGPNPMVIHDPEGIFGIVHDDSCGYSNAFVSFPVIYLTDTDIGIYWEEDYYLGADMVPDGLHGIYSYTVPEGYTANPSSSTDGHTYISLDYPHWESDSETLSVEFLAPSNCLTTIGNIRATATIHPDETLELSIEAENDPGHYLGVDQTNTYNAVLSIDTPGTYQWSVDTNYLEVIGSDTGANMEVKAVAPGQAYIDLDFTPDGADSACYASYEINTVDIDIVLTNNYSGVIPISPVYDDTPGKKWVIATFPEPDQVNVDWDVQLLGLNDSDVNIKYQRGTFAEADIGWVGATGLLHFTDGWLNASIRLNDGSNAVPQMSLSSNLLTISSVQQGDRIIFEHPSTGTRDEIAVVKNFSWNDLQRLGIENLEMHADFASITNAVGGAIVNTIIFCLDPRNSRDQRTQLTNDCFPDSGLSSTIYTNFQSTHTNLLQLDIPSARSVGYYPDDFEHWHMGVETSSFSGTLSSKRDELEIAASELTVDFREFQDNTAPVLVDLINSAYNETSVSFALFHTYEDGEGDDASYVDPAGEKDLMPGDPIRNIRHQFGASPTPMLSYPGQDDTASWENGDAESPKDVWQVGFFINHKGKIVLVGARLNGSMSWIKVMEGMQADARRED